MPERARLPLGREPVDGASCLIGSCHAIPSRLLTIAWNEEPRLRPPWFSGAAAASFSIIVATMAVLLTESSRDWRSESESELQALSIAFRAGTGGVRGARCGTATEIIRERTAHSSLDSLPSLSSVARHSSPLPPRPSPFATILAGDDASGSSPAGAKAGVGVGRSDAWAELHDQLDQLNPNRRHPAIDVLNFSNQTLRINSFESGRWLKKRSITGDV